MTATEACRRAPAKPGQAPPRRASSAALRGHVDLFLNAGSLMATTAITSLFGFAYWWVAARTAPAEAVGQASAAVSAMTLIGTIGMFGMGTMLISDLSSLRGPQVGADLHLPAGRRAAPRPVGGLIYVAVAHSGHPRPAERARRHAGAPCCWSSASR